MTMVLGSTVLYASADGYTTLKNEHLDGIVNSNNLAVTTFTNSFGPDGKVKKDWTRDLYIGLKDELKRWLRWNIGKNQVYIIAKYITSKQSIILSYMIRVLKLVNMI